MLGNKLIALFLSVTLALTATTATAATNQYKVSAKISQDGSPLASPSLVVKAGAVAQISVFGENGYELAIVVSPTDTDDVEVSAEVATSFGSVQSVVITDLGEPISVASGDIALELTVEPGGG